MYELLFLLDVGLLGIGGFYLGGYGVKVVDDVAGLADFLVGKRLLSECSRTALWPGIVVHRAAHARCGA